MQLCSRNLYTNRVTSLQAAETATIPLGWYAVISTSPDWYASNDSEEVFPTEQLPKRIELIKSRVAIGRPDVSLGTYPDLDCGGDPGCSRRHAELVWTAAGWVVDDQNSANGTFVGTGDEIPEVPIAQATAVTAGSRIYLGAWTQITLDRDPIE